jgi:hypothetical protein
MIRNVNKKFSFIHITVSIRNIKTEKSLSEKKEYGDPWKTLLFLMGNLQAFSGF